jgi:hypothetical protein
MKTNRINTMARLCGLTMTLALFAGPAGALRAGEIPTGKGGASKLLDLTGRPVTPRIEVNETKPMSCAKCKDAYVSRVDWAARGANKPELTIARHLCNGCANEWVVSGHGKAKTSTALHKCTSCGAESLACCARGGTTTNGMEKKLETPR